ncbi:MAG: glycoside hydrolase family 127 protein, partial [Chloroflexia bacterium]
MHLYAAGAATVPIGGDGKGVTLVQRTRYPWDGEVQLTVRDGGRFTLLLRIPGWCESGASISVNGEPANVAVTPGSYAEVEREWASGDVATLDLPMPVRRIAANPYVEGDQGRIALQRGPM